MRPLQRTTNWAPLVSFFSCPFVFPWDFCEYSVLMFIFEGVLHRFCPISSSPSTPNSKVPTPKGPFSIFSRRNETRFDAWKTVQPAEWRILSHRARAKTENDWQLCSFRQTCSNIPLFCLLILWQCWTLHQMFLFPGSSTMTLHVVGIWPKVGFLWKPMVIVVVRTFLALFPFWVGGHSSYGIKKE